MNNDSDSDIDDILSDLLANNDTEEQQQSSEKGTPKELEFNFLDNTLETSNENKYINEKEKSAVHDEAVDSSDEEDKRYFEEQKYSNYGRDIKFLLKKEIDKKNEQKSVARQASSKIFDFNAKKDGINTVNVSKDVYSDPFFGLRIINPIVSSTELRARMTDKTPVTVSKIKFHLNSEVAEKDWVIGGILISISPPKTSQKGSSYIIWKISDLSESMNCISVFMFGNAYKKLWKTTVGTVIGILNPNVLESRDSNDPATLSVDNPEKVMFLGKSKDMGKCRSKKKNGEPCNSIVNISRCEFCVFHIKQEYKKCSGRPELEAFSNTQKFSIDMMKKKSQPKKSIPNSIYKTNNIMPDFQAVVAVKNKKMEEKDNKRLALLSGCKIDDLAVKNLDDTTNKYGETSEQKLKKDLDEIHRSRGWKATTLSQTSSKDNTSLSATLLKSSSWNNTGKKNLTMLSSQSRNPHLGAGCLGGTIDLAEPITKKHINLAKSNAIKWVKENGKIKSSDPNKIRLSKEKLEKTKKRPRESENDEEREKKKTNILSSKFKELMEAKSLHTDLIEKSYEQEKEKYFNRLEMKERMEEKMLTTYKVPCKAVTCLICKYTSFSASEVCKEQRHPLRVTDAMKRFFKCGDCGNRTVSLDRIPSNSCTKCSSSSWTRAAMMDERKTNVSVTALSIRGDEETFIGSMTKDANLNLLVPENAK